MDQYCKKNHVELVPSLATFGHLYHALSSKSFNHLCELEGSCGKPFSWIERMGHHTLDVSNDESIEFVRDMLEQFIPLFSSDKFNICCDETFDLGMGRSKELAEKIGKGRLYVEFLNKIINIVKEHNKIPMFWGDYGHINLFANSMSGMIYGAALSWNVNEAEEEFSSMYKRISRIEFQDKTETIVGLLDQLSKAQAVSFMEIVWWKEDKFKQSDLLLRKPEYKQKYLLNLSEEEFHDKYKKAIEIESEILEYLSQAPQHKKVDFMEFYISAKGIALINSLYLIIKKYEFGEEVEKLIHTPRQLAVEIEYWLSNYCKIWRIRNKESELFRIKDTFMKICSCLREY